MRKTAQILSIAAMLGLLGSYMGGLHPLGDSLAVLRAHFALGLVALGLGLRIAKARAGLLLALMGAGPFASLYLAPSGAPAATAPQILVYQKNMSFRLADLAPLIADIGKANPDVLTLQEVTDHNTALLGAVSDRLPTQFICPFAAVGGVAIATRWPKIEGSERCAQGQGLAAIRVQGPAGPLWLVSIHLHWPWPYRQAEQLDRLYPILAGLDGPVLIGGDFNMVPWSHAVRKIANITRTDHRNRTLDSFARYAPWVPLPIDNVLSAAAGTASLRPQLGSDHHGLLVRLLP